MAERISLQQLHASIQLLNSADNRKLLNIDDSFVEGPETTRALIDRHNHWAALLTVVDSIPQLVNQANSSPLVGFLGHFSSGKSTLINALLQIGANENPPYKRRTGEQPTDRCISLTTHYNNVDLVRRQYSFGMKSIVVVQGPALPMLESMTLVDTPGLGDDQAEMDLVIQFLHLVHVLVLPVHSRTPFADSEKAFDLLNLAFNDLADVPKIFVVTNAVNFLSHRKGDFDTHWDKAAADQFWQDTMSRLVADKRVLAHRDALYATAVVFVDSIEGFQVDAVRERLMPVVTNEEQRARTDAARRSYVFRRAATSLRKLESYITSRCAHLTSLRQTAESRSTTTKTSIEALVTELTAKLSAKTLSLPVDPQQLTTLDDPLEQIVTVETIQRSFAVAEYQSAIQQELNERAVQRLDRVSRDAIDTYNKRKKGASAPFQYNVLTLEDVERVVQESDLHKVMTKCATQCAQMAQSQYGQRFLSGITMWDNNADSYRVNDVLRDVKEDLINFQRAHDDSVKTLMAYVTEAETLAQLRETGLLQFDDAGKRRAKVEPIDAFSLDDYRSIEGAVDACRDALRDARDLASAENDLPVRVDIADDTNDVNQMHRSTFERRDMQPVVAHLGQQVTAAVSTYNGAINAAIDTLLNDMRARERHSEGRFQTIRAARRAIAVRCVSVAIVLGCVVGTIMHYYPGIFSTLMDSLSGSPAPEWVVKILVNGVIGTGLGLIGFILVGIKDPTFKAALTSINWLRLRAWRQGQIERGNLRTTASTLLNTLPAGLGQLEVACRASVIRWIRTENTECAEVFGNLSKARARVNVRAQNIGNLAAQIAPWVANLPKALLLRSEDIRKAAIADHMDTIREAADKVEALRSNIVRIAENAEESVP